MFENPRHRDRALDLVQQGGGLEAFERMIGPVDQVQAEWHEYVRHLKAELSRGSPRPNRINPVNRTN